MNRVVKYSLTTACLLICLLTGCRSPLIVNAGTGKTIVVIIGGGELKDNTAQAEIAAKVIP